MAYILGHMPNNNCGQFVQCVKEQTAWLHTIVTLPAWHLDRGMPCSDSTHASAGVLAI